MREAISVDSQLLAIDYLQLESLNAKSGKFASCNSHPQGNRRNEAVDPTACSDIRAHCSRSERQNKRRVLSVKFFLLPVGIRIGCRERSGDQSPRAARSRHLLFRQELGKKCRFAKRTWSKRYRTIANKGQCKRGSIPAMGKAVGIPTSPGLHRKTFELRTTSSTTFCIRS